MSAGSRLAATLVAILVVAAVAFLALRAGGVPIGMGPAGPSPSPTATPTATTSPSEEPSASPSTSPMDEDEILAELAEIERQVIDIRGLEAADIGPAEIITREELATELGAIFAEEYPPEDQERDNVTLRALGLLEPGQDVLDLQLELLGDSVLGFYDDIERRMVIVSDAGLDTEARITYAHEYTHALQDAAFGLDTLETDAPGQDDRGLARTALIEGDATITMLAWMFQHLEESEIIEYLSGAQVPDTSGVPSWMVGQLAFPYDAGVAWASGLAGPDPFAPDYSQIDAAYDDPPASTEQILDLAAWQAREAPDTVATVDLAAAMGAGWEEVDATPVGEASIAIFLEYLGVPTADARAAADGWGGDRVVVAQGPDEAFAVAWRLAWDTPDDADTFVAAYETVVAGLDFPASVELLPSGEVLVAHASSDALLSQAIAAAD